QSLMVGRVLRIVLALVLVAVLAVLYVLSQGGDLRRQTQIASDLRNLKDIDTSWNRDVVAARGDPAAPEPPPLPLDSRLEPLLTDLKSETIGLDNPSLSSGVDTLRTAFTQKRKLTAQFDQAAAKLRGAVKDLLAELGETRKTLAQVSETDAKLRGRLAPLDGQLVSLSADVFRLYVQGDDAARKALQASPVLQAQLAEGYPEALRTRLASLAPQINAILEQEPQLTELARQIGLLPTA